MTERPTNWRPKRMESDPARVVALDVMQQVRDGAYANIALPKTLKRSNISGKGRGFATNLTYGAIRMAGRWDAIIERCVQGRQFDEIDPVVVDILRLGAHQILGLDVPLHAALNETVNLARNEVGSGASGFVNAVLHRIGERTNEEWDEILAADMSPDEALAAVTSHPVWVLDVYRESLAASGRPLEDLSDVLAANNEPALVALAPRAVSPSQLEDDMDEARIEGEPGVIIPNAVVLQRGNPGRIEAVRRQEAGVQDEGSQLVAHLMRYAPLSGEDSKWLDMCAGPGGKTATLAGLAPQDVTIYANELHGHRLDLVAAACEPFDDKVILREGDGRTIGEENPNFFDRTLVDVPCSGLGSLRRRPEARWVKNADAATTMTGVQEHLLRSAIAATRPGGIICYSTCSPDVRETRAIIDTCLDDVDVIDAMNVARDIVVPGSLDTVTGPFIQLWPDEHDTDAMFVALLRKKD